MEKGKKKKKKKRALGNLKPTMRIAKYGLEEKREKRRGKMPPESSVGNTQGKKDPKRKSAKGLARGEGCRCRRG